MSTIVVVHMSANRNTCQNKVYVGLVCLCVAQQVTVKGAFTARTLSVCSFLQTWLEKNWQSSSLVTTVACTSRALFMVVHGQFFHSNSVCNCLFWLIDLMGRGAGWSLADVQFVRDGSKPRLVSQQP